MEVKVGGRSAVEKAGLLSSMEIVISEVQALLQMAHNLDGPC